MMGLPLVLLAVVAGADGDVTLKVVSTPAGAQVSVDGSTVGKTPFTGKVEPGEHSVELTLDGYERTGKTASCVAQRDCLVSLALKEAPITVSLSSTPIGATATVDGKPVGLTPVDVDLSPGKHALSLALQGHQGVQTTLTVSRKGKRDFNFPLSAPRFQLAVQSSPPGAQLRLDGEAVGVTPWSGRTASGPHTLELSLVGFATATQDVTVLPRPLPTRAAVKLTPVPTALALSVEPKDARVLLDGKGVVANGGALPVKPGAHALEVELAGYEVQKLKVDVPKGETVSRAVTLTPLKVELVIHVTPADAEVRLDGAVVVVTVPLQVVPGTHQVEARRQGYTTVQHAVEVKPGTRGELAL
ncbi:MAG: PEGA domain-containing protein, partial [Myxococcaceae bacterium]|nr:PEGA domain-containing protein [Myxococcaceae bacterium]